jgi:hypothetical protein
MRLESNWQVPTKENLKDGEILVKVEAGGLAFPDVRLSGKFAVASITFVVVKKNTNEELLGFKDRRKACSSIG